MRRKSFLATLSALALACLGIALGFAVSSHKNPFALDTKPSPSASPNATSHGPHQLTSPFTGEPIKKLRPVIAVKIDNIVFARPQTGLNKADMVYVLPVEGGLTRFMAIFSSHIPPVIGPVRSAREDDLKLLRQFGTPGFAFSGASPQLLPWIEGSRTVDLYANRVGGYYRGSGRIAPYNLYVHGAALQKEARHATKARNIGFRFGPAPAGGIKVSSFSMTYPATRYRFVWSAKKDRWLIWIDGRPEMTTDGGQASAATIVIQHTLVRKSRFIEWGALPPYAASTGKGTAVVLRNGKLYHANWSRTNPDRGTTFTTRSGKRMTFPVGRVWILLTGNRANEAG